MGIYIYVYIEFAIHLKPFKHIYIIYLETKINVIRKKKRREDGGMSDMEKQESTSEVIKGGENEAREGIDVSARDRVLGKGDLGIFAGDI